MFFSNPKEKEIFYIPLFLELILVGAGYLCFYFEVPEKLCRGVRFFQLYTTGFLIFSLLLINFYFEAQVILYDAIKLNSGTYDAETDDWYRFQNLFHKTPKD